MKVVNTAAPAMALIVTAFPGSHGFVVPSSSTTSATSLSMGGFLDGRAPKINVRDKEDDAMWIDDDDDSSSSGGWNPFAKKEKSAPPAAAKSAPPPPKAKSPSFSLFGQKKAPAPAPAPPPPPKKAAGGFKFPWDK